MDGQTGNSGKIDLRQVGAQRVAGHYKKQIQKKAGDNPGGQIPCEKVTKILGEQYHVKCLQNSCNSEQPTMDIDLVTCFAMNGENCAADKNPKLCEPGPLVEDTDDKGRKQTDVKKIKINAAKFLRNFKKELGQRRAKVQRA